MAFAATLSTKEGRSFSIGPVKVQFYTFTAASGDTSGTITATGLSRVMHVFCDGGINYSAAPTYATNVATLAFVDPSTNGIAGTAMVIGI